MNRARRRKMGIQAAQSQQEPDFDSVPVVTICESIQMLIDNLASRGFPVIDWDNKDKTVKQIGFIGGKVYFLATKEGENEDEEAT